MRLVAALLSFLSARALAQTPAWSKIGPEGGPIQSIAVSAAEPSGAYAATPYGDLFRSSDGGATWSQTGPIPNVYGIVSVAADAENPSTVYALTRDSSPLSRSTDKGGHWTTLESSQAFALGLAADPSLSGVLFAFGSGVSVSRDAGETWQERNDGFGCPTPGALPEISALAAAPSDSSVIYAGTAAVSTCRDQGRSATFYRSKDGGAHWVPTAFPADTEIVNQIAVAPSDADSLLVATGLGLFHSGDAGATWTAATELAGADVKAVAWSATDPSRAFASASRYEPGGETTETFYRSLDGGAGWESIAAYPNETVSAIVSTSASVILAGFRRNAIYRSGDDGNSFGFSNSGVRAVPVDSIAVAPTDSSRIWAGTADGRVFRSDDAGGNWTRTALDAAGNVSVMPDPGRSSIVYAAVINLPPFPFGQVFKSVDAGAHWTEVDGGLDGLPVSVAIDPSNPDTLYASGGLRYAGNGAFKSLNGGLTWTLLDTAAIATSPFDSFGAIAVDPRNSLRLFISSAFAGLGRSEDGGKTWAVVDDSISGGIRVLDDSASTVLVASADGVWRSLDRGDHWALSGSGVFAASISEGRGRPRVVYASGRPGSAYRSTDAGATWSALGLNGIPPNLGADIVSNGTQLFAATYAGIYAAPIPSLVVPVVPPPKPPLVRGR